MSLKGILLDHAGNDVDILSAFDKLNAHGERLAADVAAARTTREAELAEALHLSHSILTAMFTAFSTDMAGKIGTGPAPVDTSVKPSDQPALPFAEPLPGTVGDATLQSNSPVLANEPASPATEGNTSV